MSRLSSVRSTRKRKAFHPSRDARLGTPAWGGAKRNPKYRLRIIIELAKRAPKIVTDHLRSLTCCRPLRGLESKLDKRFFFT